MITGLEALMRWRKPGSDLLYPKSFLYLMEETGLIVPSVNGFSELHANKIKLGRKPDLNLYVLR